MIAKKREIRKKYKTARNQMNEQQVSVLSEKICKYVMESDIFQCAEYILAYYPLGNEADVRRIVETAWEMGKHVAFPKVFGDSMAYFETRDFSELHPGTFGVMEPEETKEVSWEQALILTPGVAFDRNGNRMGFGKGYYDKYLSGYPECVTIGVAYDMQMAEEIPVEETDVPLDFMVTELGMWKTKSTDAEKNHEL